MGLVKLTTMLQGFEEALDLTVHVAFCWCASQAASLVRSIGDSARNAAAERGTWQRSEWIERRWIEAGETYVKFFCCSDYFLYQQKKATARALSRKLPHDQSFCGAGAPLLQPATISRHFVCRRADAALPMAP